MGFLAAILRSVTARIRDGRIQTDAGGSGRIGQTATRARERLLAGRDPSSEALSASSLRQAKGSWNVVSG